MSPEAQREALVKACPRIGLSSSGAWMWQDTEKRWHCCYPEDDPLSDLNAANAAEAVLSDEQHDDYTLMLARVMAGEPPGKYWHWSDTGSMSRIVSATAAQRCEAFLRSLNLWEGEP